MISTADSSEDLNSSFIWAIFIPPFQSNMVYLNRICVLCCIILTIGKQAIAFEEDALVPHAPSKERQKQRLLPPAHFSGVPEQASKSNRIFEYIK